MHRKIFLVIIIAIVLRFNGILWDQGAHLHPDERMIIMVADSIHFFDKLNPHFFNYGSLPIYLLKVVSQLIGLFIPSVPTYDGMLVIGRLLSVGFDIVTIFLIYKISCLLFLNKKVGLFASFFYAIAFFPIQNSHFYTVDTLLTMLITLLLYILLKFITLPTLSRSWEKWLYYSSIIGIVFAAMMATKFTAIIFYLLIILSLLLTKSSWKNKIVLFITFNFSLLTFNFLFMPYAFLDFPTFLKDISLQLKMNSDPYIFPYTLQYVGTTPYLYYLKNILFWGLGPFISVLSGFGLITLVIKIFYHSLSITKYQISNIKYQKYILNIKNDKSFKFDLNILYFIFYLLYFIIIGNSAVKFMRYMLPIYPFLAILASYGFYQIKNDVIPAKAGIQAKYTFKNIVIDWIPFFKGMTAFTFLLLTLIWTMLFLNIYSLPHTRITATNWILKNIPKGSKIAVEHWDDRLPLFGGENYQTQELTLYDYPDDEMKWNRLNKVLKESQYLIIASNRLYTPLQKLNDCNKYKRCYLKTIDYYQKLFTGKLSFKKLAEFSSFPNIRILNIEYPINDSSADESFTVYDHPKIMIYKKI